MTFTPRGEVLNHLSTHRYITERPAGSNTDDRPNGDDDRWGIAKAQWRCAGDAHWLDRTPWCGEWAYWALSQGEVANISYRLASVSLIEDDARAGRRPFFDWQPPGEWERVLRGDLVVLFGRGVHVETVRSFFWENGQRWVVTDGGNTSSGANGSQSNGGGSYRRERALGDVRGFARVDYPGGADARALDADHMAAEEAYVTRQIARIERELPTSSKSDAPSSDDLLAGALEQMSSHKAEELLMAMSESK